MTMSGRSLMGLDSGLPQSRGRGQCRAAQTSRPVHKIAAQQELRPPVSAYHMCGNYRDEPGWREDRLCRPALHRHLLDHGAGGHQQTDSIKAQIGQQFGALAVFDKPIGNPEALDPACIQPRHVGSFQDG